MNISALGAGETPRSLFALGKGENFRQKVIETGQGKCYYDILMKTAPPGLSPGGIPRHLPGMGPTAPEARNVTKNILHTIQRDLGSFSKGQKRIAAFILENFDRAAFLTASKLGQEVGVSESTVVRFAAELGYDGYPSMQRALQEMIRGRLTSTQRIRAADDLLLGQDVLDTVLQRESERLRSMAEETDRSAFQGAVEQIIAAKHIYILGLRSSHFIAEYLNFYLHLIFENVTLVQSNAAGEIFEQLFRIGEGDVLVVMSFPRYSQVTMNVVKFARDRGAAILGLTDSKVSPLYQLADNTLLAAGELISFVDSITAPLSMVNALLVSIGQRMGQDVTATFAQLEDIWGEYGVFGKGDDE